MMSFEWFVALRYLTAKRRQAFISLISLVSILGVGVGVMALIIALALMTGAQGELRDRIVGATAHLYVSKLADGGFKSIDDEAAKMQVDGIIGIAPVIIGQGLLQGEDGSAFVEIKGIDLAREPQVTDIAASIVAGEYSALREAPADTEGAFDGILLGSGLAENLRARVGDQVSLVIPDPTLMPSGHVLPRIRLFKVVGIFKFDFHQFDSQYAFVTLATAESVFRRDGPDMLQMRLRNMDDASTIASTLQNRLGVAYLVQDWMQLNGPLYSALWLEKVAIALTIGLIVMVAALNIVASLVLLVMEKSRDIGILRTMGAPARSIRRIFVLQGMTIGLVGTATGTVLGLLVSWIFDRYQLIKLPDGVYQITYLPFDIEPLNVAIVVASALLVCFAATIYPSRRASRLDPAEALRYQ